MSERVQGAIPARLGWEKKKKKIIWSIEIKSVYLLIQRMLQRHSTDTLEFHINRKKNEEASVGLHHSAQDVYVHLVQMNSKQSVCMPLY